MPEAKTVPAKYIFLDIVGFTHNRSVEAQSDIIQTLNSIVESSIKEYGILKEDVLFLPSGDGICVALLNIESPYDIHLSVALAIIREVSRYNAQMPNTMRKFEVRVGLNANTDNLITDINGHRNIAGAGVNTAQRVMNFADGNQILASDTVFETLRYHEKYISSFRSFRAKIRHGLELSVHQFTAAGHEGLNTSVSEALQTAVRIDPKPVAAVRQPEKSPLVGQVEFTKKPVSSPPPAVTQQSVAPQLSVPDTKNSQTFSYLNGILAEQAKNETKPQWIKPKPEQTAFLEQVVPPKRNRSLLWAFLTVLILGGAGVAAWALLGGDWQQQLSSADNSSVNSLANSTSSAANTKPVNTVAPAVSPSTASNKTVAETTAPTTSAPKSNQTFTPKTETVTNTVAENEPSPSSTGRRLRPGAPRAVVQRAVSKPPAPAVQKKQSPQPAKVAKPKPSKKVTLDDLINGNR